MHSFVVEAWINDVAIANVQPDTPSPSKRARTTENDDEIASFELDTDVNKTPVGPSRISAVAQSSRSASSFPTALASRPAFWRDPSETSRSQSRSASPTKRFLKTESLLSLAVPIDRGDVAASGAAVASRLSKRSADPETCMARRDGAALQNHEHLCRLVDESLASANRHRSEAGWNNLVHTPLLQHATQNISHLEVEPIMLAQILPACRPLLASGKRVPLPSSEASTAGSSASGRSFAPIATSVHKMVDYALVLRPSDTLQTLINEFLASEPWERQSINQTRYEPLRAQPAPIFIETKTISGTKDSANMQLGIWVAAWRERMP
ncbi:hypothetical protein A9K55_000343 [Cordyceps militaris]|uniref:PD-(D/E)XK nuclease-like domain-containing protein n=1 Tax=Cordyceps militaris TaxID=73501 RepID=A0A2H4SVW1_CORMI|nr:hypothetical protein A9K55_000343 [Cordyceps militaris]